MDGLLSEGWYLLRSTCLPNLFVCPALLVPSRLVSHAPAATARAVYFGPPLAACASRAVCLLRATVRPSMIQAMPCGQRDSPLIIYSWFVTGARGMGSSGRDTSEGTNGPVSDSTDGNWFCQSKWHRAEGAADDSCRQRTSVSQPCTAQVCVLISLPSKLSLRNIICQVWRAGFVQIPVQSWNFVVQNSRPWKVLEKGIHPGKSWKVLEL